jgi:hypothetical protein
VVVVVVGAGWRLDSLVAGCGEGCHGLDRLSHGGLRCQIDDAAMQAGDWAVSDHPLGTGTGGHCGLDTAEAGDERCDSGAGGVEALDRGTRRPACRVRARLVPGLIDFDRMRPRLIDGEGSSSIGRVAAEVMREM